MHINFLVMPYSLSNIDITEYFNYKPRFNGIFSGIIDQE